MRNAISPFSNSQFEVKRYPSLDSTNHIALDLGGNGAAHGTVVQADEQSGGRGRKSRQFFSPHGGLYMSAILRVQLPAEELALVTLAAGVACAEAIEQVAGVSVQLKWPNDLYSNGRKLGGILTEAAPYSHELGSIPFVVVGIGVNVNTRSKSFPDSLQDIATSLYCETGLEYNINQSLNTIMRILMHRVSMLAEYPENILSKWRERDYMLAKDLSWKDPQGKIVNGTGNGLLPDGRYLLTTTRGDDYPVLAGDIAITDINGEHIK